MPSPIHLHKVLTRNKKTYKRNSNIVLLNECFIYIILKHFLIVNMFIKIKVKNDFNIVYVDEYKI